MSQNFQFGYQHHLYLGYTLTGDGTEESPYVVTPEKVNGTGAVPAVANPKDYTNVTYREYLNVTTVNVGGSSQTVDITTRQEARSGFSTEVIVTTKGQQSFDVRYKPRDDAGHIQDLAFEAMLQAWLKREEIWAIDLDKSYNALGAQGLFGNWTLNITNKKELQGVVMCTLEMSLSSYPTWIRRISVSGDPEDLWTQISST